MCAARPTADACSGMIYAQAEDDFNRIETNYLTNLGRLAEAEGRRRSGRTCATACSSTMTI
jgi:acyl-homoserine lactone acylase PvdQ